MNERNYAVIGHPIGHTMSPFIHRRLFELAGTSGHYTVIDIPPEKLSAEMTTLQQLDGYNITIPHKQRIMPFLDRIDKKAALYGAVNTVCNKNGSEGFTTDPDGFLLALQHSRIPLCGKVVILGCGGVARTFAFEAALAGCEIVIAARQEDAALCEALLKELSDKLDFKKAGSCLLTDVGGDIDLLINATPVGMYPHTDAMPVSEKVLSRCQCVFDAVYNPLHTRLIETALSNGSKAAGGMAMLVGQAAVAHRIWDGSEYDEEALLQLAEDSAKEQNRLFA